MAPRLDSRTDLDQVEGWFYAADRLLFRWFLEEQARRSIAGNVVELGAYLGKSAIVIGDYLGEGETFTVVDLFGSTPEDAANAAENSASYSTLTRAGFEANYLTFHDDLPQTFTALSAAVLDHVAAETVRFMHVDASHLYEHVVGDAAAARTLLRPDGIVVFDDFRSEHTPGVAAAVWQTVLQDGLKPICVTPSKLYGTWGDADLYRKSLSTALAEVPEAWQETQRVAGHDLLRVAVRNVSPAAAAGPSEVQVLRRQLRRARARLRELEESRAYRLGRALSAPGRLVRRR